jgi:1,4-dihydroxy-6-naphthoate synthase
MKITLGFSPCPNDTYMFCALLKGWVDTKGLQIEPIIKDVQELNRLAITNSIDVTKVSYYTYCKVSNYFILLDSGSALGSGVGPLIISLPSHKDGLFENCKVLLPGQETTAHFLFDFYNRHSVIKEFRVFNDIEPAVLNGSVDFGVIIHENRFTYESKGLVKIADLGEYWEAQTKLPIPLGGIVSRSILGNEFAIQFSEILKSSIEFANKFPEKVMPFVRQYSQEMDEDVMQKHINLYVNDYSLSLGENGLRAVSFMKSLIEKNNLQ